MILDAINEKVVVARDALAKLQETANPLISAADPTEVENPITIQGSIVSNTEVLAAVVEARTVLKAHEGKVLGGELCFRICRRPHCPWLTMSLCEIMFSIVVVQVQAASSGPWLDAKTEIAKLGEELSSMEKKVLGIVWVPLLHLRWWVLRFQPKALSPPRRRLAMRSALRNSVRFQQRCVHPCLLAKSAWKICSSSWLVQVGPSCSVFVT